MQFLERKTTSATGKQQRAVDETRRAKPFSDVARNHLCMALAEITVENSQDSKGKHRGYSSCFDSCHVVPGFHVIAHEDYFSRDFLCSLKSVTPWRA